MSRSRTRDEVGDVYVDRPVGALSVVGRLASDGTCGPLTARRLEPRDVIVGVEVAVSGICRGSPDFGDHTREMTCSPRPNATPSEPGDPPPKERLSPCNEGRRP